VKQLTKTQACLAVVSLMLGALVVEQLLSRVLPARVSLSATSFGFLMLLGWVFDRSPMPRWPKITLANKLVFASVMAFTPLVLSLLGV
jgi:hypothetical protein